jgi:hypothetical protein
MSKCYTRVDLATFDPTIFFEHYDWFEIVPESISDKKDGLHDFGNGSKSYKFVQYVISDKANKLPPQIYLVACEVLSEKEREMIAEYCQCNACTHSIFESGYIFPPCACCVGCLTPLHI